MWACACLGHAMCHYMNILLYACVSACVRAYVSGCSAFAASVQYLCRGDVGLCVSGYVCTAGCLIWEYVGVF